MKHLKQIAALILSLLSVSAHAQMPRLYTSADGLANSHINNLYQDSRDFIWICTENGLSRFDGRDFKTFRYNRNKSNSIASNLVRAVIEDSNGTYWVGTSSGLQIFDAEYNSFYKVDLQDPEIKESDQHISAIAEVEIRGKRCIIAASSGHGLYIIDPDTKNTDRILQAELNSSLPSQFIRKIYKDSEDRLWVAAENGGIGIIDLKSGKAIDCHLWEKGEDRIIDNAIVTSFAEDTRTGKVLLGSFNFGLIIYDPALNIIRKAHDNSSSKCRVEALLKRENSYDGYFIVGTEDEGLKTFRSSDEKMIELQMPELPHETSTWKVHCLMEDRQNNLWIGAFQRGIMVVPESMYGFEYISLKENGYDKIGNACVTTVTADTRSGGLWVGTDGSGLYKLEGKNIKARYTSENSGLSNNSIMSAIMDKHGRLWVATYLGGIFTWTPENGFRQFKDQKALNTRKTVCLAYSRKHDMLFVGTHGNGMSVISPEEEKVIDNFSDDDNKWISTLYIDSSEMVWIGTYNGPMRYDISSDKLVQMNIDASLSTRTHAFCETGKDILWIGTGEGLVKFDRKTGTTIQYTENDGLSSNVVNEILKGNDGNLWIATLYGLNRFDPETNSFKNYYHSDGLQENEFHSRASYKTEDGKMYFGGINGLTAFYPHIIEDKTHKVPPLYFSELNVMNEPVSYDPASGDDNILDKTITEATSITIPFNKNIFSIRFSVLEYTNPKKIMYTYMLEGFDATWNIVNSDTRMASYTNVPSGRYTLKVKAYYDGDPDVFSYRNINLRILPPWYRSIWAFIGYMIILVIIGGNMILVIKRENARKKEREESDIKELKLRMFTNISHEIRTPLTLVMNPLKKLREAEKDPKQKELYNLMYRNSLRILRLVNQLLDMRKVDNGQMKLHFLETDVVYFIKDIMNSFENLAVSKNIDFSLVNEEDVSNLWIDQGNFDKIIFNILSNAFKHTPDNGKICIKISAPVKNDKKLDETIREYVEFIIENTGNGVDEKYLGRLFDRFFQVDIHEAKEGSGVGLNLAKMLVELHHGSIKAVNTDTGIAFIIRIPVGYEHLSEEEMTRPTNHIELYTKLSEHRSVEDITYAPETKEEGNKQVKTKRNIVLIDDDSEMRAYLKLELGSSYNIETFESAKDAWAHISTNIPDAIVTDLIMKDMDGAELCAKVKKNPGTNHIPVIILTSSGDENNIQRCTESGADRFFTKPISLDILKSAISSAISTRDAIRNKFSKEIDYKFNEIEISDSGNQLIDKVIRCIRNNIDNSSFSVEDLSREIGMSRVHLNRKLKEHMNISPSNLIRSIRLKQAAFLLINNNVNISEVAYKVGFSTHSYFSNSFHDYFGMTPKEFVAKYMDCTDQETLNKIFN